MCYGKVNILAQVVLRMALYLPNSGTGCGARVPHTIHTLGQSELRSDGAVRLSGWTVEDVGGMVGVILEKYQYSFSPQQSLEILTRPRIDARGTPEMVLYGICNAVSQCSSS